jgi:hypothetical protein
VHGKRVLAAAKGRQGHKWRYTAPELQDRPQRHKRVGGRLRQQQRIGEIARRVPLEHLLVRERALQACSE